jgi:hypothetical protein
VRSTCNEIGGVGLRVRITCRQGFDGSLRQKICTGQYLKLDRLYSSKSSKEVLSKRMVRPFIQSLSKPARRNSWKLGFKIHHLKTSRSHWSTQWPRVHSIVFCDAGLFSNGMQKILHRYFVELYAKHFTTMFISASVQPSATVRTNDVSFADHPSALFLILPSLFRGYPSSVSNVFSSMVLSIEGFREVGRVEIPTLSQSHLRAVLSLHLLSHCL